MLYYHIISFFFFKQKTAYDMRISDWSSDVCSSDLRAFLALQFLTLQQRGGIGADRPLPRFLGELLDRRRARLAMIERGRRHRRQVGDIAEFVTRRVGPRREVEHRRDQDDAIGRAHV